MKLNLDNLLFEVTRKCNMECLHCLRGKAQDVNISRKIINRALKDVTQISSLSFTGGEPTLNIPAMKYIFKQIHKQNIELQSFWLATNGKVYNQSFMNVLFEEYVKCVDLNGGEFYGGIAVSHNDGFHEGILKENLIKYQCVKFYDDSKAHKLKNESIISDGNARINSLGERKLKIEKHLDYEIYDNEIRIESELYINALGDVLLMCDLSYARQKRAVIGNVLKTPLIEIIKAQIKNQDPEITFQDLNVLVEA